MKDSLTAAKRLVFSLDDIVLCDPIASRWRSPPPTG
jgi:hypothetical protein